MDIITVNNTINGAIARRLVNPARKVCINELSAIWQASAIEATIPGLGALIDVPNLLAKIKGAWVTALLQGASVEARNNKPCAFRPVCSYEALYKEQGAIEFDPRQINQIPKPFVFEADRHGQNLVVRLILFGFANEWKQGAGHCLVHCLHNLVRWKTLADGLFIPTPVQIQDSQITEPNASQVNACPTDLELEFITPFDVERGDISEQPSLFMLRLARRIYGLSLWQGLKLDIDWQALHQASLNSDFEIVDSNKISNLKTGSKRQNRKWVKPVRRATILISGAILHEYLPLLVLGQQTHIGRGATSGLGRYKLHFRD